MPQRESSERIKILRLVFSYYLVLVLVSMAYYILHGFDKEEFTALAGVITPITALYGGILTRSINLNSDSNDLSDIPTEHAKWTRRLVHLHLVIIITLISLKAIVNWINFQDLLLLLTFFEVSFGVYLGNAISQAMGSDNKN